MTNNEFSAGQSHWKDNTHSYQRQKPVQKQEKPIKHDNSLKVFLKNYPSNDPKWIYKLKELFSSCGNIIDDQFFERKLGQKSLPQGLLVFSSAEEALKATEITGTLLGDRHVIASGFHQFAKPSSKMVHITNISPDTDEEDLWCLFEEYGTIRYIHINRPLNCTALGAEVHFKSKGDAKKSLTLNGTELKGQQLCVTTKSGKTEDSSLEYPVFVTGLPRSIDKEAVINFFTGCGPIKRIKINSKHEEYAHAVVFFTEMEAKENALACNGNELDGYVINVTHCEEGVLQAELLNPVFIANISRDTKEVDIFLAFQDCGLIQDIKFVQSKRGTLRKAFIEFKNEDSIPEAVGLDGLKLKGKKIRVGPSRKVWLSATSEKESDYDKEESEDDDHSSTKMLKPASKSLRKTKKRKTEDS